MLSLTFPSPITVAKSREVGARPRLRTSPRRGSRATPPRVEAATPRLGVEHLFTHARDAIVVEDIVTQHIVEWNPAAERLFGYTESEAVGQPVDILMPPPVARLHQEQLAHYARSGEVGVLISRDPLHTPVLTSSGDEIRVELSVAPLGDPALSAKYVLLMFRDASAEKHAELQALVAARAESAYAEIEANLRQRDDLVLQITRELEVPVARLRRAAARLARVAAQDAVNRPRRVARMARVVEGRTAAVQRSSALLADSAAIKTGTFVLGSERVNLVPLVGRVVAAARARWNLHQVKLGAPQGLTATGDSARIEQVVNDLIERAVHRNPHGCWIDVDLRRPLVGVARIEVRDYGRRLSLRELGALPNGANLDRGWYVDRHIVEQHGGTLVVEFPDEGGARVIVTLPTNGGRVCA
jgi:PAS domain S-box-containing protein